MNSNSTDSVNSTLYGDGNFILQKTDKKNRRYSIQNQSKDSYGLNNIYDGIYGKFLFKDFEESIKELASYIKNNCKVKKDGTYDFGELFDTGYTAIGSDYVDNYRKIIKKLAKDKKITKMGARLLYSNIDYIVSCLAKSETLKNNNYDITDVTNELSSRFSIFSYMKEKWIDDLKVKDYQNDFVNGLIGDDNFVIRYYIIEPIISEIDTVVAEANKAIKEKKLDKNIYFIPEIVSRLLTEGSIFKAIYDSLREYLQVSRYLDDKEYNKKGEEDKTIDSNVEIVGKIFGMLQQVFDDELSKNVGKTLLQEIPKTLIFPVKLFEVGKKIKKKSEDGEYRRKFLNQNNNDFFFTQRTNDIEELKEKENRELNNLKFWSEREKIIAKKIKSFIENNKKNNIKEKDDSNVGSFFRERESVLNEKEMGFFEFKHRCTDDYNRIIKDVMLLEYNLSSTTRLLELIGEEIKNTVKDEKIKVDIELGRVVLEEEEVNNICKEVANKYRSEKWGNKAEITGIPYETIKRMVFVSDGSEKYKMLDKDSIYSKNYFGMSSAISGLCGTIKNAFVHFKNGQASLQQIKNSILNYHIKDKFNNLKTDDIGKKNKESEILKNVVNRQLHDYFISGQQSDVGLASVLTNITDNETIRDISGIIAGIVFWSSFISRIYGSFSSKQRYEVITDVNGNLIKGCNTRVIGIKPCEDNTGGEFGNYLKKFNEFVDKHTLFKQEIDAIFEKAEKEVGSVVDTVIKHIGVIDGLLWGDVDESDNKSIFLKLRNKIVSVKGSDGREVKEVIPDGVKLQEIGIKNRNNNFFDTNGNRINGYIKIYRVFDKNNNQLDCYGYMTPNGEIKIAFQNIDSQTKFNREWKQGNEIKTILPNGTQQTTYYEGFVEINNVKDIIADNSKYFYEVIESLPAYAQIIGDAIAGLQIGLIARTGLGLCCGISNIASGDTIELRESDENNNTSKYKMYTREFQRLCGSMDQVKLIKQLQEDTEKLKSEDSEKKVSDNDKMYFVYEMIRKVNAYKNIAADKIASLIEGYIFHYLKHRENAEPYSNEFKGKGVMPTLKRTAQHAFGLIRGLKTRGLNGEEAMDGHRGIITSIKDCFGGEGNKLKKTSRQKRKFKGDLEEEINDTIKDMAVLKKILEPNSLFDNIKFEDENNKEKTKELYEQVFGLLFGTTEENIKKMGGENPFDAIINLALQKTVDLIDRKYKDADFRNKAKLILEKFQNRMTFEKVKDKDGSEVVTNSFISGNNKIIKGNGKIVNNKNENIQFYKIKDGGNICVINPERLSFSPSVEYNTKELMDRVNKMETTENVEKFKNRQKRFEDMEERLIKGNFFYNKNLFQKKLDAMNDKFNNCVLVSSLLCRQPEEEISI